MTRDLAAAIVLLLALGCASQPIQRVTVRDRELAVVRSIDDPRELRRFAEAWAGRTASSKQLPADFDLVLDIEGGASPGRWQYATEGLARVLSAKRAPTYAVPDPAAFNSLLGSD